MAEQRVCRFHGGKIPGALRKAEERRIQKRAAALVVAWEGHVEDDPMVQLRRMVRVSAMAEQAYAQLIHDELGPEGLLVKTGSHAAGFREEPHPYVTLWNDERDRLAKISSAAIRDGLAEREAKLQEEEAQLAVRMFEGAMEVAGLAAELRVKLRLAIGQQAQQMRIVE
jgi:hypothetical protein